MIKKLAEPSSPQWVGAAGLTIPGQQWCTRSWGLRTVGGSIDSGGRHFRHRFVVHVEKYH